MADKRHRNYKSQLQEYVQSTFRTHPVYRIRSQMGPDHSKLFLVEVMVGRRALGEGRGTEQEGGRAGRGARRPGAGRAARRSAAARSAEPREARADREPREAT